MRALILAAGFGTRLTPITEVVPKPLLPVGGIPVIRQNIEKLTKFGICEIVINIHHFPELIRSGLADIKTASIFFSEEKKILGTAGGVKKALEFLGNEDFLIVNSDILSDINYQALIDFHKKKSASCTLALREDKASEMYGTVETDHNGRVRRFLGNGFVGNYEKYMYTGIQVMNPGFLKNVSRDAYCDLSKEVYPEKVYEDGELFGFVTKEYWTDIGKPLPLLDANRKFIELFAENPAMTAEHKFINNSAIHKSSAESGAAGDVSSSFIGKNVTLEEGVTVHNSVIMNGARIKKSTVLRDSIVGPGTVLDSGTYERLVVSMVFGQNKFNRF